MNVAWKDKTKKRMLKTVLKMSQEVLTEENVNSSMIDTYFGLRNTKMVTKETLKPFFIVAFNARLKQKDINSMNVLSAFHLYIFKKLGLSHEYIMAKLEQCDLARNVHDEDVILFLDRNIQYNDLASETEYELFCQLEELYLKREEKKKIKKIKKIA